ncbi:MAG: translation initiation factor eIF-1A [Candidatus Aenigmarchaeota archaeon]|nr:translation initiation factor eIF-1A [Candidatus Aenigmarchaeota archaeon]
MEEEVRVRTPKSGEVPGVVEAMLGANKLRVRCQDGKVRMGRIPGKLRKRVWIRMGDVVLLKPWDIQGETHGDVVWRYTLTEANALKRKGFLAL